MTSPQRPVRLLQLDGLRAIAALSVVAFHYTTRYDQVLVHQQPLGWGMASGYLGVQLFFVISGFVIFMTLEAARTPADFAFSRFTRLFPVYWVAVVGTWGLTLMLPLPGNIRTPWEVLANLTMVHEKFGIRSVDGAYWSLGVELVYYLWMLALASLGWLRRVAVVLAGWCALSALDGALIQSLGQSLPYAVSSILLLKWIPWFALGMLAYCRWQRRPQGLMAWLTWSMAIGSIMIREPFLHGLLAVGASWVVLLAARGQLPILGCRLLVFFGVISYPLYLIHEQLGWLSMHRLQGWGLAPAGSMLVALTLSVCAAVILNRFVEVPVTERMRAWWRDRPMSHPVVLGTRRPVAFALCLCVLLTLSIGGWLAKRWQHQKPQVDLSVNAWPSGARPCRIEPGPDAKVLLILGQSNAASHAYDPQSMQSATETVDLYTLGRCGQVMDPLPGTSGQGRSVWTAMAQHLPSRDGEGWILSVFAVGATRIAQWISDPGLRGQLDRHLSELKGAGLVPSAVLWHQGEADALRGTAAKDYLEDLKRLRVILDAAGIQAPLYVARSTYCRQPGSGAIGRALDRYFLQQPSERIRPGPDFDATAPKGRWDGCHFDESGRQDAAKAWVHVLDPMLRASRYTDRPANAAVR